MEALEETRRDDTGARGWWRTPVARAILKPMVRIAILPVLAGLVLARSASAQTLLFEGGFSHSWGSESATICLDSLPPICGKGRISSNQGFDFLGAGLTSVKPLAGPFQFESGARLVFKGWEVTEPGYKRLYADVPLLLRVGAWPVRSTIGAGFRAGLAPGLGMWPPDVDLSLAWGADFQIRTRSGSRYSVTFDMLRGLRKVQSFHLHTVLFLFGYSPARHREALIPRHPC